MTKALFEATKAKSGKGQENCDRRGRQEKTKFDPHHLHHHELPHPHLHHHALPHPHLHHHLRPPYLHTIIILLLINKHDAIVNISTLNVN